jgi:hypothetical protein
MAQIASVPEQTGTAIHKPWILLTGGTYFVPRIGNTFWLHDFEACCANPSLKFDFKRVKLRYIAPSGKIEVREATRVEVVA